jgi:hypothetical protein
MSGMSCLQIPTETQMKARHLSLSGESQINA